MQIEKISRIKHDTKNPLLNAVINVEQEKASVLNIVFTIEIAYEMIEFSENSDIV